MEEARLEVQLKQQQEAELRERVNKLEETLYLTQAKLTESNGAVETLTDFYQKGQIKKNESGNWVVVGHEQAQTFVEATVVRKNEDSDSL